MLGLFLEVSGNQLKDRFNDGIDSGQGAPQRDPTDTHAWRAANKVDTTKLFEDRQAAEADRAKAASDARQQYQEENIKIFKAGDRLDYGATEAAQKAAREKWAKLQGRTLAPTTVREWDWDTMTDAEKRARTPDELKKIIAKQRKGRGY